MRSTDSGDFARVTRCGEPIIDSRANPAALDRRLAGTMVSGNEQYHALTAGDRLIETAVDRCPGAVQIHPVKIDDSIRHHGAAAQLLVPASVEGGGAVQVLPGSRKRPHQRRRRRSVETAHLCSGSTMAPLHCRLGGRLSAPFTRESGVARQRSNGRGDARPELGLVRAERAHERQRLWALGSALRLMPTCRRRSSLRPVPSPKRCRSGSAP